MRRMSFVSRLSLQALLVLGVALGPAAQARAGDLGTPVTPATTSGPILVTSPVLIGAGISFLSCGIVNVDAAPRIVTIQARTADGSPIPQQFCRTGNSIAVTVAPQGATQVLCVGDNSFVNNPVYCHFRINAVRPNVRANAVFYTSGPVPHAIIPAQ